MKMKWLGIKNKSIIYFQEILSEEPLSLQFFDVVTILLKYCVPKCHEKGETQAVIIDLIATLGFYCANNKNNQVRMQYFTYLLNILRA